MLLRRASYVASTNRYTTWGAHTLVGGISLLGGLVLVSENHGRVSLAARSRVDVLLDLHLLHKTVQTAADIRGRNTTIGAQDRLAAGALVSTTGYKSVVQASSNLRTVLQIGSKRE